MIVPSPPCCSTTTVIDPPPLLFCSCLLPCYPSSCCPTVGRTLLPIHCEWPPCCSGHGWWPLEHWPLLALPSLVLPLLLSTLPPAGHDGVDDGPCLWVWQRSPQLLHPLLRVAATTSSPSWSGWQPPHPLLLAAAAAAAYLGFPPNGGPWTKWVASPGGACWAGSSN